MKTTNSNTYASSVIILIIAIVATISIPLFAQDLTPPKPIVASSELQMPEPIQFQELKGRASLPDELKLGLAIDLDGIVLMGNWKIQAKVVSIDNRIITFVSEKEETGHLVYRLPKGFELSLETEEKIGLQRTMVGNQTALGYQFFLRGSNTLELAAGNILNEIPHRIKLLDGLLLEQNKKTTGILIENQYETHYNVPVVARTKDRAIKLNLFEQEIFKVQGNTYKIMVIQSTLIKPSKKYEEVSEGAGYLLEYVLISEK